MMTTKSIVVVGSINLDLAVSAARNPHAGETILGTGFDVFTGGKGANQAVAAARLGHDVHMIGKLGGDKFAAQLLKDLDDAGVHTETITPTSGPSGVALIIGTDSGENRIIVIPGANDQLLPCDIERNSTLIRNVGIVLTQLEIPLETTEALVELTSRHGVPLILDPAPFRSLPAEVLRKTDWITPNESETQLLIESTLPVSDDRLQEVAEYLLSRGPRNVLLKLGERGAYLATQDGARTFIPPFSVRAIDTTAAGDAFNGAFAVALVRGSLPVDAARFASAVAAISVTRRGALPSMPTQAEVDSFLTEQSKTQLEATQ
ncbi:MAG: ribokinase [Acidobacteriaceae bacterium]